MSPRSTLLDQFRLVLIRARSSELLCLGTQADAQTIITASRRIDWNLAGVIGGIPNRTTMCATLNPGATATQINTAIASCTSGQVVFLNAGAYTLSSATLVKVTMMRWGNYDTVRAATQWNASEVPSSLGAFSNAVPGTQALPNSFYLSGKPSWWTATPWPAIGPDISGGADPTGHAHRIPAHACYDTTSKTGGILNFNASNCYLETTAPAAPTNLRIVPD